MEGEKWKERSGRKEVKEGRKGSGREREGRGERKERRWWGSPWLSLLATHLHLALELHKEAQTQLLWSSCTITYTSLWYTTVNHTSLT